MEMNPEASAAVASCSAWLVLVALVDPLIDLAAAASAVGEASVGAFEAPSPPVTLLNWVSYPHHSDPGIPVWIVSPTHLHGYALTYFHTWNHSRHLRGSGRLGCQGQCPPTFRIPLAISSTRLDGLLRSSLRIPKSVRIADPRACASWTLARRQWMPSLGCFVLRSCQ